ncbi:hypothetical protein [Kytococcus sedentarius]|uniref:hypothetical protein n=1 Tax=Kytococcus sedentarius TaxID=1276 RepID=UPI0035BC343C
MGFFSSFLGLNAGVDPVAENARLARRVALLEAQVAELAQRSGTDLRTVQAPSPVSPEVRALALRGQPVRAIKLHREQTGLGLRAAKDDVDAVTSGRV